MSISLMVCFARSGGTLLNKCLGSLPNVVILSEVNPLGGGGGHGHPSAWLRTPKAQALGWYGYSLHSEDYAESILELEKICQREGKQLVVRDWSYVNFAPIAENNGRPPNRLLTYHALNGRCDLKPFAFVRNAVDVWMSRGMPNAKKFTECYLNYLSAVTALEIPMFKYEAFVRNPEQELKKICALTGVEFSDSYKNYDSFVNVNGDVQGDVKSRGQTQKGIAPLERRVIPWLKRAELNSTPAFRVANELVGYDVPPMQGWKDRLGAWMYAARRGFDSYGKERR